jgi:fermentation-respiration switch protein FrsA (DUF1100 family)
VVNSRTRRIRRVVFAILRIAAAAYIGAALFMYLYQSRLVFQPSRDLSATPKEAGLSYEEVSFRGADGTELCGWFVPVGNARASVLFCHGNGGNISDRLDTISVLHGMGLDVFIFDYRGYGKSQGKPTEEGTYQDAEAAWKYLTEVRKVPPEKILIVGHSLGGPIAAHLASRHAPGALVLEGTFTSMGDLASHLYPWLPVRWLLGFKYDTAKYIAGHKYPLLVVHSGEDKVVPFKFGRRLYEGTNEPKRFLEITGTHDEGFETSGRVYTDGWKKFLDEFMPQGAPASQR